MSIIVKVDSWDALGSHAAPIRHEVFCLEQNVPKEMEWDAMDAVCAHAVAYDAEGAACGTGRLLPDGHIGRMAVLKSARGDGIGGLILERLIDEALSRGMAAVVLHAQTYVRGFYEAHGFQAEGEEFLEAGIRHVLMRRRLD